MHRTLALLAGLLMISQVAAALVTAAELHTGSGTEVIRAGKSPAPPQTPTPGPESQTISSRLTIDRKVELDHGVWENTWERHSTFRVTNAGTAYLFQTKIKTDNDQAQENVWAG